MSNIWLAYPAVTSSDPRKSEVNKRQVRKKILRLVDQASPWLEDGRGRVYVGITKAIGLEERLVDFHLVQDVMIDLAKEKQVKLYGAEASLEVIDRTTVRYVTFVEPWLYQPQPLATVADVSTREIDMNKSQMRRQVNNLLADNPTHPVFANREGKVHIGLLRHLGVLRPTKNLIDDIFRIVREMHGKNEWLAEFGNTPRDNTLYKLERGPKFRTSLSGPRDPVADALLAAVERPAPPADAYASAATIASQEAERAHELIMAGHDMGNITGGAAIAEPLIGAKPAIGQTRAQRAAAIKWEPRERWLRACYIVWAVTTDNRVVESESATSTIATGMGIAQDDGVMRLSLGRVIGKMFDAGEINRKMARGGRRTARVELLLSPLPVDMNELRDLQASPPATRRRRAETQAAPVAAETPAAPLAPLPAAVAPQAPKPAAAIAVSVDKSDPGPLNISTQGKQLLLDAYEAIGAYDELRERFLQLVDENERHKAAAGESEKAKRAREQQATRTQQLETQVEGLKDELLTTERELREARAHIAELEHQIASETTIDLTDRQRRALTAGQAHQR